MDWSQVLTLVASNVGLVIVSLGVTITMFKWARAEAREDQAEIRALVVAIQTEMKDFHGRLEKLDAEFKSHIMHQHRGE